MLIEICLAAAFQVGPFYEQKTDYAALRPFWSEEKTTTDVLWPIFTAHEDWWRFCLFTHYQSYPNDGYQFEIMPLWFNGRTVHGESYAGLFPIYGYHPNILTIYDFRFALWPLWMQYRCPRPRENRWMTSNVVLFPFIHWRDDGSWGVWPLYSVGYNRESTHRTALWPVFTWASYEPDRDTAGAGSSWMVWPLFGSVDRERESQWLFLPPLFSHSTTPQGWRGRYPWPLVEIERRDTRRRTSVFPFYDHVQLFGYGEQEPRGEVTRFLWKLIELYDDEVRVFPIWANRHDWSYSRCWPFWEVDREGDVSHGSFLSLFPIRWVDSIDRNWAKFWTFYERDVTPVYTDHSLLWGIIRWRTLNE